MPLLGGAEAPASPSLVPPMGRNLTWSVLKQTWSSSVVGLVGVGMRTVVG